MPIRSVKKRSVKPDQAVSEDFFVPDLCRVRAVFMLLIISELMVLLLSVIHAERQWIDWNYFGLLSLFVQWTVLTSAALICLIRRWLQRFSIGGVTATITLLVVLDVLVFSLFADQVLHPGYSPNGWQAVGKNLLLAMIITLMVLRYFYLQHQWQQQRQAEMQARLTALQARIHPHFLFNSMNTIASLIVTRPEQAEEAVLDLSELFRASLRTQDRLIPLGEELALCRRYLMIEGLRLGDRLSVEWAMEGNLDLQAIPPLTIQPLVENAIYHGIQPRPEGGKIRIEGYRKGDYVYLMVQNPRPATGQHNHVGNRMALDNIQARLRALFGEPAVLKHSQQDDTYTVTLRLPWQNVGHAQPTPPEPIP
ncbi:sensor histidine kinase [Marinobacter caseinilyticus]|uniref:sensor histidine kinase n=1 Tax=Marinobacter caseinilyticus TaxID=2692195 RepID=UPI00140B5974|nr:sensor histidine kinase [Marinobacter caseinilyticus]